MDTKTASDTRATVSQRTSGTAIALRTGFVVLGAALLVAAAFVALQLARPGTLPGVMVAGTDVGGIDRAELEVRLSALAERFSDERITLVRDVPAEVDSVTLVRSAGELGYRLDVQLTSDRVMQRGHQANPLTAVRDHIRAFRGDIPVAPVETVDEAVLAAAVQDLAAGFGLEAVEGGVALVAGDVQRTDPAPGVEVSVDDLQPLVHTAVLARGDTDLEVPVELHQPETTVRDVDAAVAVAERALSAPLALVRAGVTVPFGPAAHLSDIFRVQRTGSDVDGERLGLVADPAAVAMAVPDSTEAEINTDPVDARITLSGGAISISPSAEGFAFDPEAVAAQLVGLSQQADPAARTAELAGTVLPPARSTADAEALGITEKVSEFTTQHACCQGRVTNIQQMARTVDGVIIEPGETFSLNGYVGERTRAKGYVPGGAILNGEFIDDVGGGVSQFTTTMYNAAFFGGYAIPEHKPHSYYISRYPMGREATLDYPTVDLKIRNNSPHGILVDTSFTPTSITVAFWGTRWVEVGESTGQPRNVRQGETQYRDTPDLPRGATRVVQSAGTGFDVTVVRTLTFPDGRSEREEIFTRYLPQPQIVERGTGAPPA